MSIIRNFTLEDGPQLDAFNRLRVSEPATVMAYSNRYDEGPLFWEDAETATGTAVHLPNESSVRLRVAASGDKVVRQSRHYHPYQPGKSQFAKITFVMGAATANVLKRVGYFDDQNGIYFEQENDGTLRFTRRTYTSGSAVNNEVDQSSWNLDTFDGNGASGITLDITKSQILLIDLQWLGVGRVRIGFEVNGMAYYCHEFLNANSLALVYMTTAALPVRYEIEATGAPGGNVDLIAICAAVDSEGGLDFSRGIPFSISNGVTTRGITAQTCCISIRPKATFNSIVNRGLIIPEGFGVYTDGTGVVQLIYNTTIGGSPSWTSAGASSIVEYDVAGTTATGGIVLSTFYVASAVGTAANTVSDQVASVLPLTLDIAGSNPINLSVVYTPIGAGTDNIAAFLDWREVR